MLDVSFHAKVLLRPRPGLAHHGARRHDGVHGPGVHGHRLRHPPPQGCLRPAARRGSSRRRRGPVVHLAQWISEVYGRGTLLDAPDPRLDGEFDAEEMECVLLVGLCCTHQDRCLRPSIRQAVSALRFEAPPPSLAP
ncbi:hypothetical protein U9M48_037399 [Paspalum notatum var. saurae]|uniref:Uncharacterized protein n=1 Tax=Paspalum notatum var. saurae TaxID=547442 RepID=A0AAQ3XAK9_PASNO